MFNPSLNPDILEIMMKNFFGDITTIHESATSMVSSMMEMKESEFQAKYSSIMLTPDMLTLYQTKDVLQQANITTGINLEVFLKFCKIFLLPDFIPATQEIILNTPDRLQLPDVNMDEVKYPLDEHLKMEYNWQNFKKLLEQTNDLSPKELGERVIFMPRNLPPNYDKFETMFSTLYSTEEIDLEKIYSDTSYMDVYEKSEYMQKHKLCFDENNKIIREPLKTNSNCLTLEKLQKYKKDYDFYINVDSKNNQLYTRGRVLANTFIQLNDSIKYSLVAQLCNSGNIDNLNIFLGERVGPILKNYATLRVDADNYPIFSQLYVRGALYDLTYPQLSRKGTLFMIQEELNFIKFSLVLYEGNDGLIYIIVILDDTDYWNFIEDLITNFDHYKLSKTETARLVLNEFCMVQEPMITDAFQILIRNYINFPQALPEDDSRQLDLIDEFFGRVTVNQLPWLAENVDLI